MDRINRAVVKQQARELIKGKWFYLFLISMVVSLLTGSSSFTVNVDTIVSDNQNNSNYIEDYGDNYYDDYYDYFSDNFGDGNTADNPIEDFSFNSNSQEVSPVPVNNMSRVIGLGALSSLVGLMGIANMIFMPLTVTLVGIYLAFIRRNPIEKLHLGESLSGLFKDTFNKTYVNKLVLVLLRNLFIFLWSLLLIVPGIVYYYKTYFANQILADNPNLKPTEALKLSKKMTQGGKTELFTLDVSFILWYLLCIVTFGIASIYVVPYVMTAQALYYENFRLRGLAHGVLTDDDFLSEQERFVKYNQPNYYNNPYGNGYGPQNNNQYANPYYNNQNGGYYYNSQSGAQQQQPQNNPYNYNYNSQPVNNSGEYYQPPVNNDHQQGGAAPYYSAPAQNPYGAPKESDSTPAENPYCTPKEEVKEEPNDNPYYAPPEDDNKGSDN